MKAAQCTSQPSRQAEGPVKPIDLSEGKARKDEDLDEVVGGIKPPPGHQPTTRRTYN